MYLCVRGINVPNQGSEQSCICVLEVSMYQSREVNSHVLCVRGINVPIQGSEQSCVCVLEVSMYQTREVNSHVFVC